LRKGRGLAWLVVLAGLAPAAWSCSGGADGDDDCGQCFRAVTCVEECGGEAVQVGCCACPDASFDDIECAGGGGGAGGGAGGN